LEIWCEKGRFAIIAPLFRVEDTRILRDTDGFVTDR